MSLVVPRITDFNNPRQKFLIQQFMKELLDMAFKLTFLTKDGAATSGERSYNMDAVWVQYVSNATANTEDTVNHNLKRIPIGFFTGMPSESAVIYADNQGAWTSTTIRLKCTGTAATTNLLLF